VKKVVCALVVILAASLIAQTGKIATWSDNVGNMTVENWTSWRIKKVGDTTYTFKGIGNPFKGIWKKQGLTVRGKSVEGTVEKDEKGAMQLMDATIDAVVDATLTETPEPGVERTTVLHCQKIVFDGEKSTATLTGGVEVISKSPSESQTLEIKGSKATLDLVPFNEKSDWPIKSGEISGPVTMRLDTLERDKKGKEKPKKIVVTGKASRIVFNDAARTVTLYGAVELDGSDTVIGSNVTATKAVITLDEKREIVDVELSGDPGKSTLRDGGGR
jgi:lipopolysaccharide export system protein LptA